MREEKWGKRSVSKDLAVLPGATVWTEGDVRARAADDMDILLRPRSYFRYERGNLPRINPT